MVVNVKKYRTVNCMETLIFIAVAAFVVMQFTSTKLPKGKAVKKQLQQAKKQQQAVLEKLKTEVQQAHNGGHTPPTTSSQVKTEKIKTSVKKDHPLYPVASQLEGFTERDFLQGAKQAYAFFQEMLKKEDWEALGNLCAPHLIHELRANETKPKPSGTLKATALTSEVTGRTAFVDVKFESTKTENAEIWTFAKSLNTEDPNWELEEIQTAS